MRTEVPSPRTGRLERSCAPNAGDWIRHERLGGGLERIEAFFTGHAYDPHRHDFYAIGFTCHGVQNFQYRGTRLDSAVGNTIVIHPDECHDGRAAVDVGFRYRMVYVEPALIATALGGATALPFAREAVGRDERLRRALLVVLSDLDEPLDDLRRIDFLTELADALSGATPGEGVRAHRLDRRLAAARDVLGATLDRPVRSEELEDATGLDRYTIARRFRAELGTSPYRYALMRRLAAARERIGRGDALADVAAVTGFADQSHLTRHFKRALGVTPGAWRTLARAGRPVQ